MQTLTRVETGTSFTVAHNDALNRQSIYRVERLANGDRQRTNTLSDGTQSLQLFHSNDNRQLTVSSPEKCLQQSGE